MTSREVSSTSAFCGTTNLITFLLTESISLHFCFQRRLSTLFIYISDRDSLAHWLFFLQFPQEFLDDLLHSTSFLMRKRRGLLWIFSLATLETNLQSFNLNSRLIRDFIALPFSFRSAHFHLGSRHNNRRFLLQDENKFVCLRYTSTRSRFSSVKLYWEKSGEKLSTMISMRFAIEFSKISFGAWRADLWASVCKMC